MTALPWWLFMPLASATCVLIEVLNRGGLPLPNTLARTAGPIVAAQVLLYYGFRGAPDHMLAWGAFALSPAACRLLTVWWMGGPLSYSTYVGVALALSGAYLLKR